MSNSSLVNYTAWSPNYDSRDGVAIREITIHHMAGNLTVETCGSVFRSREASAHYGIGSDGRVGQYVDEKYAAWANGNFAANQRAVTIEVANDQIGGNWHVSDKALAKCIQLVADICKRNGIKKLNFTGTTSGNLTAHKMYMATTCPGPYLYSKFSYIAAEANKMLVGGWVKDGSWYYFEDGKAVTNAWRKDSKGKWFYLGSDGKMVVSTWVKWKGEWYYLKASGEMASSEWQKDKTGWCYVGSDGKLIKGAWIRWKNNMYYVDGNGHMITGDRNVPCTFDKDGKLVAK